MGGVIVPPECALADVHWFLDLTERFQITVWLDGGWGVDALLGRQTRPHSDLDIAVETAAGQRLHEELVSQGFRTEVSGDHSSWNYVLGRGHLLIDLHLIDIGADGDAVTPDGTYPALGFTGTGTIGGRTVRCIEATTMIDFHTGYAHDADDQADVLALCAEFDLEPPLQYRHADTYAELLREGEGIPTAGWDFGWFDCPRDGKVRATEERPPWGYARGLAGRLEGAPARPPAQAVLDIQTGGGEVLNRIGVAPPLLKATESWPPNVKVARNLLGRLGGEVLAVADTEPLPFADATFDLVCCRHPTVVLWDEIGRVLAPGGHYYSQQVGVASVHELSEAMLGPFEPATGRSPERAVRDAEAAGLEVVDLQQARLTMEFFDIAAVVYFLRKVIWIVPDFTVAGFADQLARVDRQIRDHDSFVAHSTRFLIDARR